MLYKNSISISYIFFLIFISKLNCTKSYLIFPLEYLPDENYIFHKDNQNTNIPSILFQQIYYRNLITKIKVGSTQKNQIFFIEINKNRFYVSSINPPKIHEKPDKQIKYYSIPEYELYNEKSSSTYNEIFCKNGLQNIDHYIEICMGRDRISFKNEDKSFLVEFPIKIAKNHDENIPGMIGLLINDTSFNSSRSLLTELISENLIDNYNWFIDINEISPLEKKINANLIIGGRPHEIYPEKYSKDNYKTQNSVMIPYVFEAWRIRLDKIYIEGIPNVFQNNVITLAYEFYHIIGTYELLNTLKMRFLNRLVEEKKCFLDKFPQNIYTFYNMTFYYCDISTKDFLYSNIPSIKFFSFDLSYIFELSKEELFYIKDNYIYFNILFCQNSFNFWIMGQLFTIKYNFVFNTDNKRIGFYHTIKSGIPKNSQKPIQNKKNNNLLIVFMIIIAILFTCIGLFLGRKIFGLRRKIIVNELIEEQNYEYKAHNKVNSNEIESNYKPIGKNKEGLFEMTKKY